MRQHGTNSCYAAGCRRGECREAHNAWSREHRMGRRSRTKADPYAAILRELTLPRVQIGTIAAQTGIHVSHLRRIRSGEYVYVNEQTAQALRAALLPLLPGER